jgi:hypothetical protein
MTGLTCAKCHYGGLRIIINEKTATCLRAGCGHVHPLMPRQAVKRVAPGTVPAGEDCKHTSTCARVLRGECYRAQFQGQDYPCQTARVMEGAR